MKRKEADAIAERTQDAYSFFAYGHKRWRACCRMLAKRGYDAEGIEAIMRSKWTRWAGDASSNRSGEVNSADLARFLDSGEAAHRITPKNWKDQMGYSGSTD